MLWTGSFLQAPSADFFATVTQPFPWESDEFLQPVLTDDGLLQYGKHYLYDKEFKIHTV